MRFFFLDGYSDVFCGLVQRFVQLRGVFALSVAFIVTKLGKNWPRTRVA